MLFLLSLLGLLSIAGSIYGLFIKKINFKVAVPLILVGAFLLLSKGFWFYAEPGMVYFKQSIGGVQSGITKPGISWRGFGTLTPWNQYLDVKTLNKDQLGDSVFDEIEGKMPVIDIRFIDQVTAKAAISVRFKLPNDPETFKNLAVRYRTQENLIQSTLIPTVKQVTSNTGYMFSAQDYISGSASDFRTAISDQLKHGEYSVEKLTIRDTIASAIKDSTDRGIKEIKTSYIVKKRANAKGVPLRIMHDVNTSGVSVDQAIIDDIHLNPEFKKRLTAQRDESAKRQLEQQKIKTAKDAQQRIIAEGERDKAAERVAQEKTQIAEVIQEETKVKTEKTKKDLALIQLETAKLHAKSIKVTADADAYRNSKLVKAGLTPLEKAKLYNDRVIGVARETAKLKLGNNNTYMLGGGQGKGDKQASLLESILSVELLKKNGSGAVQ
jgi:hypothetical protein